MFDNLTNPTLLDDMTASLEEHKKLKLVGRDHLGHIELDYLVWRRWIA